MSNVIAKGISAKLNAEEKEAVRENIGLTISNQAEAEAAESNERAMTPLRTKQQVEARVATQAEAEAGTNAEKLMTPLRTKNQIDARRATQSEAEIAALLHPLMTPFRTKQQIDARLATQSEAEAGFNAQKLMTPLRTRQQVQLIVAPIAVEGHFIKPTKSIPLFAVDSGLITTQPFSVAIGGSFISFTDGAFVTLPSLVAANDYKIFALSNGTMAAQAWDTADPANSRWIGGFHTRASDGVVIQNSLWDLGWRPSCNPRGMTLSIDQRVWVDIYLMGIGYGIVGYSYHGETIASGSNGARTPFIPVAYGGDGFNRYGSLNSLNARDLASAASKRLPTYGEFTAFAYGVEEGVSNSTNPINTSVTAASGRSSCGVEQVTGFKWQPLEMIVGLGSENGPVTDRSTEGRGRIESSIVPLAVYAGGSWDTPNAICGSRSLDFTKTITEGDDTIAARAVCDHQII
jgi:hypothetical protein